MRYVIRKIRHRLAGILVEYGCIGEKLGHSFSKLIHNKLFDYCYELKEIPKDNLEEFMRKSDFKAINVTIPYKESVIPYLNGISDIAREIGAVNTIVNRNGKLFGFNTDYMGMKSLINFADISLKNRKVLILGSGGTSKTANAVAKSLGSSEVYLVSRKEKEGYITYSEAENKHKDAEIIINTTPCGMYPNNNSVAVDISDFPNLCGVIDAVYNPLRSKLVVEAQKRNIHAIGGLYMLVAQAVYAAEKFRDLNIDISVIDKIYKEILSDKENIVLIGMPSCGKTTVGKELAKIYGKRFIDTDELIEKKYGNISEIFKNKGEEEFRKIESLIIEEVSKEQSAVISTGGGAVLNPLNVSLLKGNGKIIFLNRSVEKLIATSDRPLSSNREMLSKRYEERYGIYCSSADIIVDANGSIEENIQRITEVI